MGTAGADRPDRRGGADRGRDPVRRRPRAAHDGRRPGDRRPDARRLAHRRRLLPGDRRGRRLAPRRRPRPRARVDDSPGRRSSSGRPAVRRGLPGPGSHAGRRHERHPGLAPSPCRRSVRRGCDCWRRSGTPAGGSGRGAGEAGSHGATRLRGAAHGDRCTARQRAAMRRRVSGTSPRPGPPEFRRPVICCPLRLHGTSLPRRVGRPAGAVAAQRLSAAPASAASAFTDSGRDDARVR